MTNTPALDGGRSLLTGMSRLTSTACFGTWRARCVARMLACVDGRLEFTEALVQVPPGFECGPESTFARLILETGAQVCAVCASCGSLAGIDADACTIRRAQACVQNLRAHIKLLQDFSKEAKRELGEYFRQYDELLDKHFPADGTAMQQEYRKALAVRDLYGNGARRKAVFGKFDFEAYREELLEFLSVMDQHIGESYIVKVRLCDV